MDTISKVVLKIKEGIEQRTSLGRPPSQVEMSFGTYVAILFAWVSNSGKPDPDVPTLTNLAGLRITFNPKVAMWHVVVK